MKNGAIVANSGHFNVEIDIPALLEMSTSKREARPFVEEYDLGDGRHVFLLGEGRLINLAAAEGHPAAVMDMSFANQALAAEHIAKNHAELERKVYVVPEEIDKEIAKLKLETHGHRDRHAHRRAGEVPDELGPGHLIRAGLRRDHEGDAARGRARHAPAAADLRAAQADGADPRPAGDGAHHAAAGAARLRRRGREPALLPRPDPRPVRRRLRLRRAARLLVRAGADGHGRRRAQRARPLRRRDVPDHLGRRAHRHRPDGAVAGATRRRAASRRWR